MDGQTNWQAGIKKHTHGESEREKETQIYKKVGRQIGQAERQTHIKDRWIDRQNVRMDRQTGR